MSARYRVIRYGPEHIHVLTLRHSPQRHVHAQCYLSRNWSRCTVPDASLRDYRDADTTDRSYWNGSAWVRAPRETLADTAECFCFAWRGSMSGSTTRHSATVRKQP